MFKRFWWVLLLMLPVGAIGGLLVAAVVTYVMPKKYESEAVIEVRPAAAEKASLQNDLEISRSGDDRETPVYMRTAVEEIKSSALLGKTVEKLELINKWAVDRETAIRILKETVNTQSIRNTDLMSIRVRHTDREAARDIAGEVARVYRDYRTEIMNRDQERNLAELNKAVKDQEGKVEERRKVLSEIEIARKKNITVDGTETLLHLPDSQDYIDAKRDFETDQALLQSLKLKQISATIHRKMTDEGVIIHEEPQVPQVPVSPSVTLNLILGAVGGFLLSPLLALPGMLLLNRLNPVTVDSPPVRP